ncbi:MAG TPA: PCRF domain-containing protein, partial [Candidatus Omnitrophota bacterium]|nr:PCRF domain-containing protein [Candidatus Omnitrophota bacterium]
MPKTIEELKKRKTELEHLLADPNIIADTSLCVKYAKELAEVAPVIKVSDDLSETRRQLEDLDTIISDPSQNKDFVKLAEHEKSALEIKEKTLDMELKVLMAEP